MWIVKNRKIFFGITIAITIVALAAVVVWGFNLGIDFKGGSLMEIRYAEERPNVELVKSAIDPLALEASIREAGSDAYLIRMKTLSEPERVAMNEALKKAVPGYEVSRFTSVGPVLGKEAARKSITSIVIVLICIVLFIAFVFRKVSEPVSSWKYGFITILALFHDIIVPAGVFAYLGHFQGVQVDTLFVTALLVVLGFSVHDTIVVFDRVRENLKNLKEDDTEEDFEITVGKSVSETYVRSINTSLTVLFALAVLYTIGGEATRYFTLALLVGIFAGTYSSIFLASPLLVTVQKMQDKKLAKK